MQQNPPVRDMLEECQAKEEGYPGEVTIPKFKDALKRVHPLLTEDEIKHLLREIEVIDGRIKYGPAITQHEL